MQESRRPTPASRIGATARSYRPWATRTNRAELPRTPLAKAFFTELQETDLCRCRSTAPWMFRACIGTPRSARTRLAASATHATRLCLGAGGLAIKLVACLTVRRSWSRTIFRGPVGLESRPTSSISRSLTPGTGHLQCLRHRSLRQPAEACEGQFRLRRESALGALLRHAAVVDRLAVLADRRA